MEVVEKRCIQKCLWLFRQRLTLSFGYYPTWNRPIYSFHENGGRHSHECFDAAITIWRLQFGLTLWGIRGWRHVLRWLPGGRGKPGLWISLGPKYNAVD